MNLDMELRWESTDFQNPDFQRLCEKLDAFQNVLIPERKNLPVHALDGLENLQYVLMVYDNETPAACGALKRVDAGTAELARMYTEENYRCQGLAKQIIDRILQEAAKLGYKTIILDTWKNSRSARHLYQSLGFELCGPFDAKTFQNSFSTDNEQVQTVLEEKLVFMKKDL